MTAPRATTRDSRVMLGADPSNAGAATEVVAGEAAARGQEDPTATFRDSTLSRQSRGRALQAARLSISV